MFKKTVVMMALVMMAANAFAAVEVRSEARDEKRTERDADAAGLKAAHDAGIKDARMAESVGELVRDSAIEDAAKGKTLADALVKVKDNSRTVGGKVIRASDVIASLGAKVKALRAAGKMSVSRAKNALFETQFIALAFRNVKDPNSQGAQVAAKEASLSTQIIDPSWDGTASTSHINLQKDMARTMQSGHVESDVAMTEVFKKNFKEDATKRADEDIHCE